MTHTAAAIGQAERARRTRILLWVLYVAGAAVLGLTLLQIAVDGGVTANNFIDLIETIGIFVGVAAAWGLVRAGLVEPAAHMLFATLVVASVLLSAGYGVRANAIPILFLPIVGTTLFLRPLWSFVYAGLALLGYLIVLLVGPDLAHLTILNATFEATLYAVYFGSTALVAALAARGYEQLLAATRSHADALEQARADLETRVEERTRDVRQAMQDLQHSAEIIKQMSVPVVPLADGVLLLPLVGAIDSQRAALLMEQLLEALHRERARTVLIDITGVPVVDTQVAGVLIQAAQAVRLLGAEPVLVGVRPEVAQTVVGLGLDLSQIAVMRDVRSALAYTISGSGMP